MIDRLMLDPGKVELTDDQMMGQSERIGFLIRQIGTDGARMSQFWTNYFQNIAKEEDSTHQARLKFFLNFIWNLYKYQRHPTKDLYFQLSDDMHCKYKQVLESAIVHITLPKPFLEGYRTISITFLKNSITIHTDHSPFVHDNVMIYDEMDVNAMYDFIFN